MRTAETNRAHTRLYLYQDGLLLKEYVVLETVLDPDSTRTYFLFTDPAQKPENGMLKVNAAAVDFDEDGLLAAFRQHLSFEEWKFLNSRAHAWMDRK